MKLAKPTLYVAFGMVLGVGGSLLAQTVVQREHATTGSRLTAISVGSVANRTASFVSDPVSGGCWLVVGYGTGDASPSVAVAPVAACRQ
jgi:hypothetical protein